MIDNTVKYRPIHRLLVANRGEIAVRIIRTAKQMGIITIGITTEAEPQTTADEEIFIEGITLAETYLNIAAVIFAAQSKKADAIHPGYGFLSENPLLAEAVQQAGLTFVGPTEDIIQKMGDKTNARLLAQSLDIPTAKGFFGTVENIYSQKQDLPYPLLIKAAAGGGGKGMLMVTSPTELLHKLKQAQREAERYFGETTLLVEQLIHQPRHIEVQILADHHGNCIHLYERECSIQRRYQKIIEESPSPFVTETLREKLTSDAIKLCKSIGYQNAGTVEFLVDQEGNYFFLEMNTRLQVEHPVTELITNTDIVEQQLLIAMGLPIQLSQEDVKIDGHALECRIYAEDPQNNFQPAPGKILKVQWPNESLARTDSWFDHPIEIRPDFDPMLAKIITHAPTRLYAIEKMKKALETTLLMGNINNIWYLKNILNNSDFKAGRINTDFCEIFKTPKPQSTPIESVAAAILIWQFNPSSENSDIWRQIGFFRFNNQTKYFINGDSTILQYVKEDDLLSFSVNGSDLTPISEVRFQQNKITFALEKQNFEFNWANTPNNELLLESGAESWKVIPQHHLPKNSAAKISTNSLHKESGVKAPIPGKIIEINIHEGEEMKAGDTLMVLEAMKMENRIQMPRDGIVKKIFITPGKQVKANEILVEIENIKE
ncbi:MAG TPA: biotin carboxylase N-terminal domain-containing protein [Marinilabiliaceae bacterium]|nr:biotin carboxylase N-terminal domain-containing protein [Marinilabiliaceae bacterium]